MYRRSGGCSLSGMRPIVVHPRMDFMLYAMDAIVNEAMEAYDRWASRCTSNY